jgi:hypothetical protein
METLVSGTVEYLLIDVADRTDTVTTMADKSPIFNVFQKSNGTQKITDLACVVDGARPMQLRCLINTTSGGNWPSDEYELYVKYTVGSEVPEHGPYSFYVEVKNTI